jgi:hypothetical protein
VLNKAQLTVEGIGGRVERVEGKGAMANDVDVWLVLARGSWQIVGQAIPSLRGGSRRQGKEAQNNTTQTLKHRKRNPRKVYN